MVIPLDVRFRRMRSSEAVLADVREHAGKLDRFHPHLMSCRVMVEALHRRHNRGAVFHVRIDATVPGHELVAHSEPPPHHFHRDVFIAVHQAFDAMRRELEDEIRRRRGDVKAHAARAPVP